METRLSQTRLALATEWAESTIAFGSTIFRFGTIIAI